LNRTGIIAMIAAFGFVTISAAQAIPEAVAERAGVMSFEAIPSISIYGAPGREAAPIADLPAGLMTGNRKMTVSSAVTLSPLNAAEAARMSGNAAIDSRADSGYRVGIERRLERPVRLERNREAGNKESRIDVMGDQFVWTASFRSPGAEGLRLLLDDVHLPAGAAVWVYSREGEAHGPYRFDDRSSDPFWTNAVYAPEVFLEVQSPRNSVTPGTLTVSAVGHLDFHATTSTAGTSCFSDASCVSESDLPGVGNLSRAVAEIVYADGNAFYVCSGALINTSIGNSVPYFLTANHCIPRQASAATVEAYWDYHTSSCNAAPPARSQFRRTLGATLLSTGSREQGKTDYSLLQLLDSPPPGRYYLGWSTDDLAFADGAVLYRIAHPDGSPQSFSKHVVSGAPSPAACAGLPQGLFLYSKNKAGATQGGSSGSPAVIADGLRIVGQLYGRCGQNLEDSCDAASNSTVDGSFRLAYPSIARWLDPGGVSAACSPTATVLCLSENRFKVSLSAVDQRTGTTATGRVIPQNDMVGYFSLPALTMQPDNPDVFVKILDGRAITGKYWVFYGGLTDVGFTMTVTDTATGAVRTYTKIPGSFCGGGDTSAF